MIVESIESKEGRNKRKRDDRDVDMEIVNHPTVVCCCMVRYCEVGLMWGMNFRIGSSFLPTHDYTHPCDSQTLSGYDFSAVGYDTIFFHLRT